MKLTESIALVGSSRFGLSNPFDCSIYAIDCGDGVVLIDAGAGLEPELIEANMRNDGFDPALVKAVVITHTHADHAGGCRWWKDRTGCQIIVPEGERGIVEGTEDISQVLETAKRAGIYPHDYVFPKVKVDVGVRDGQEHLNRAIDAVKGLAVPPNFATMCPKIIPEAYRMGS